VVLSILLAPVMAVIALVVLVTGIVALARRRPTWLRMRTRAAAVTVTAVSAAVLLVAGGVSAATLPGAATPSGNRAAPFAAPSTSSRAPASPRATPTPRPVRTTTTVTTTQPIPFAKSMVNDATLAKGTSRVRTPATNGVKTQTYRVTLLDGKEVSRELISDVITTPPVTEVTAVGTYVAPPPAPKQAAPACDPNYAGNCVPIASDVDCAGGRGNGPKYLVGTARVVGQDIYDLDRDGDGIACDD
ncbi:G5 domain-containing protein, partial [Microbacterium sp.]|uniref:G5 domain-containing protein n=1 Tax=Microbacterium sp. TaxID=51671 RepID=UPI0025F6D1A7